jgi:hypothetical protein
VPHSSAIHIINSLIQHTARYIQCKYCIELVRNDIICPTIINYKNYNLRTHDIMQSPSNNCRFTICKHVQKVWSRSSLHSL